MTSTAQHKALIESFYTAFKQKDYQSMAQCYHPEAYFKDEAFELTGKEIGAMCTVIKDRPEAVILSGDIFHHKRFTNSIIERVEKLLSKSSKTN